MSDSEVLELCAIPSPIKVYFYSDGGVTEEIHSVEVDYTGKVIFAGNMVLA